jgi:hypothetical protein
MVSGTAVTEMPGMRIRCLLGAYLGSCQSRQRWPKQPSSHTTRPTIGSSRGVESSTAPRVRASARRPGLRRLDYQYHHRVTPEQLRPANREVAVPNPGHPRAMPMFDDRVFNQKVCPTSREVVDDSDVITMDLRITDRRIVRLNRYAAIS